MQEHKNEKPILIGEVLRRLFDIECISKELLGDHEEYPYTIRLDIPQGKFNEIVNDLNEAIALICVFEEKGMIYLHPNSINDPIGQSATLMRLTEDTKIENRAMFDTACFNSWKLLNSYYYLTNGFDDYVENGYKTVETRRHHQVLGVSFANILLAICIAVVSSFLSFCMFVYTIWWNSKHNQIKLDSKQYEQIIELLYQKDVQMSNQTTKIIDEIDKEMKSIEDSVLSAVKVTSKTPVR